MRYAKKINGEYQETKLPKKFNGVENIQNGYKLRTDLHIQDGFFELTKPEINSAIQKYGAIIFEDDKCQYEVIDYTAEEIAAIQEIADNKLRIDAYDKQAIIENIKHYLEENLTLAVKTVLDENIERVFCLKDIPTPLVKIVYTKETNGSIFIRRSNMYAFKVNGELDDTLLDTRIAQYTEREIISFKTSLVNNVMNIFKTKAKETFTLIQKLIVNMTTKKKKKPKILCLVMPKH